MRAAAYLRVSSASQREKRTIDSQNREVPAYIGAQGWRLARSYTDDGKSASSARGKLEARHGLLAMLDDAEAGCFDVVVAWDVDRLTRAEDQIERAYIIGRLQRAKVKIASPATGLLDLDTFAGDMVLGMKAAASADWLRQHRARTIAGKITAARRGHKPGGPTPFGLVFKDGAWSHHPRFAPIVREMFERVSAGHSTIALAAELERRGIPRPAGGRWTSDRIVFTIQSDTYVGKYTASKARGLVVDVPPIVDADLALVARSMLASRAKYTGPTARHPTLLAGLAVCTLCKGRIGIGDYTERGAGIVHGVGYRCIHRRRPPQGAERCDLPVLPAERLDAALWPRFVELVTSRATVDLLLARTADAPAADPSKLRGELAQIEAAQRFLSGQVADGAVALEVAADSLARLATRHKAATEALSSAIAAARGIRTATAHDAVSEALEMIREEGLEAPLEERREAIRLLAAVAWISPTASVVELNHAAGQHHDPSTWIDVRPAADRLVVPHPCRRRKAA